MAGNSRFKDATTLHHGRNLGHKIFWGEKRIDLDFWHQRCHMLIESETRKTKAPEVRHVIGSNPFQ
jgi:hypothetical protein